MVTSVVVIVTSAVFMVTSEVIATRKVPKFPKN